MSKLFFGAAAGSRRRRGRGIDGGDRARAAQALQPDVLGQDEREVAKQAVPGDPGAERRSERAAAGVALLDQGRVTALGRLRGLGDHVLGRELASQLVVAALLVGDARVRDQEHRRERRDQDEAGDGDPELRGSGPARVEVWRASSCGRRLKARMSGTCGAAGTASLRERPRPRGSFAAFGSFGAFASPPRLRKESLTSRFSRLFFSAAGASAALAISASGFGLPLEEVGELDFLLEVHQTAIPRPIGMARPGDSASRAFLPTETFASGSPTRTLTPIRLWSAGASPSSCAVPPARTTSRIPRESGWPW